MVANSSALAAISDNIANVNTPNYSRQVVNFEQRVLAGFPAGSMADAAGVLARRVLKQRIKAEEALGASQAQAAAE